MIALAVVLDREFPIATHRELEPTVRAAMIERFVELCPTRDQIGVHHFKRIGLPAKIDPDDIAPDMAAHLVQTKRASINALMGVLPGSAHMRRAHETPFGAVTPTVIGAANCAFDLARGVHKDHSAMSACVLKHANGAFGIANDQQGRAQKFDRLGIPRLRHIGGHSKARPAGKEHGALFFLMHRRVDVMRVRQTVGARHIAADSA
jgi:hypothetical protein